MANENALDGVARIRARLAADEPERAEREAARARRRRRWAFGALFAGVVGVGGLAAAWSGDPTAGTGVRPDPDRLSASPSGAPASTEPQPPPTLASDARRVLATQRPAGMRCRNAPMLLVPAPASPRVASSRVVSSPVAATVCTGGDPALRVELRAAARRLVRDVAAALFARSTGTDRAPCFGTPRKWSEPERPTRAVGIVRCGRSAAGAEIVWTLDEVGVVARAVRSDDDLARLVAWWDAGAVEPR